MTKTPTTIREKLLAGYGECRICHKLLKPDKKGYPLRHGGHAHPCPGVRYPLLIPYEHGQIDT